MKRFNRRNVEWLAATVCLSVNVPGPVVRPCEGTAHYRSSPTADEPNCTPVLSCFRGSIDRPKEGSKTAGSPKRGPRLVGRLETGSISPHTYSEETSCLMVDLNLTSKYEYLRQSARQKGCQLYPLVEGRRQSQVGLPAALTVQPDRASSSLQELLDHTAAGSCSCWLPW